MSQREWEEWEARGEEGTDGLILKQTDAVATGKEACHGPAPSALNLLLFTTTAEPAWSNITYT